MEIQLYPYNQETYNKIRESWIFNDKVAVVQATGTGKSYLILKILFDFPKTNKVVLAPSNYILDQFSKNVDGEIPNTKFLTYAKLSFMTESEIEDLNPLIIILDEFHRCGADVWGNGVKKILNKFPDAKILGTSATPIRYLDGERDMSDELFEGNAVINLDITTAIVRNILPMPKYVSALYTFEEEFDNLQNKVKTSANKKESKEILNKEIEVAKRKLNKSHGIPRIIQKHLKKDRGKFIVFCKDKKHLIEMRDTVIKWFEKGVSETINVFSVYNDNIESDAEFSRFVESNSSDGINLLFCINMLNEGLHIEDISGVILLRPTISPILYYQQIGRAIQAGKNGSPIIFDFVNNFSNVGAKNFLSDLESAKNREIKEYNRKNEDIPDFTIYDEVQEIRELFDSIEGRLISSWKYWFEKLSDFARENGHTVVARKNERDKNPFAKWVVRQRTEYNKGILSSEKVSMLNSIGFVWDVREDSWDRMFKLCEKYTNEHGKIKISKQNGEYEDLPNWISKQRAYYSNGTLEEWKIEKLNSINFVWDVEEKRWMDALCELKKFIDNTGHLPTRTREENHKNESSLYTWLRKQKTDFKKGKLSEKRIKLLSDTNIDPSKSYRDITWESYFEKYKEIIKNLDLKYVKKSENYDLWSWANRQRSDYKNNKLSSDRIDKLNEISFLWNEDSKFLGKENNSK